MTWIFNKSGTLVYKSDWTDFDSLEMAVEYLMKVGERRRNREQLAPFRVERIDYRVNGRDEFYKGLQRNGPKAVSEFQGAFD